MKRHDSGEPIPGQDIQPEDLKGDYLSYYRSCIGVFKKKYPQMSAADRSTAAMIRVRAKIDKQGRQAAADKKQLKLF
jgi:hypothetical protein